jgi:DNA-binding response OmpR family regulator
MFNPPSIMVVDDEEELAHLFRNSLECSGFISVSFTDPLLALEYYSSNASKYSVVLTDLKMPHIDGVELAKRIREYDSKVKILLVTAFFTDEIIDSFDFKRADISDILQKPVKLALLRTRIKELCGIK